MDSYGYAHTHIPHTHTHTHTNTHTYTTQAPSLLLSTLALSVWSVTVTQWPTNVTAGRNICSGARHATGEISPSIAVVAPTFNPRADDSVHIDAEIYAAINCKKRKMY